MTFNGLIFLDVETTGLDPEKDDLLEVGVLIVNEKLEAVEEASELIYHRWIERDYFPAHMDQFVIDMHEKSGLWEVLRNRAKANPKLLLDVGEAETRLLGLLKELGVERGKGIIAGYSIHFDRRWIARHMPTLDGFLSHRMIDVSSFREMHRMLNGEVRKQESAHRAVADCWEALNELKLYLPKPVGAAAYHACSMCMANECQPCGGKCKTPAQCPECAG